MKSYLIVGALGTVLMSSAAFAHQSSGPRIAQAPAPNPTNQQADPAAGGQSKPGTPAKPGPQGGPAPGNPQGNAGASGQTPDTSGTAGKPGGEAGAAEKKPTP